MDKNNEWNSIAMKHVIQCAFAAEHTLLSTCSTTNFVEKTLLSQSRYEFCFFERYIKIGLVGLYVSFNITIIYHFKNTCQRLLWNHQKLWQFCFLGIHGQLSLTIIKSSTKTNFEKVIFLTETENGRIYEITSPRMSRKPHIHVHWSPLI